MREEEDTWSEEIKQTRALVTNKEPERPLDFERLVNLRTLVASAITSSPGRKEGWRKGPLAGVGI